MLPAVQLQYGWQPDFDLMRFYRATSPDGPWTGPIPGLEPSGYFTDTNVAEGMTYWYRIEGANGIGRAEPAVSAILSSEGVTAADDPYPPEAHVLINGGEAWTPELLVTLSFVPYESEGEDPLEVFEDIVEVRLSNNPDLSGAVWQAFVPEMPWTLDALPGEVATVYAQFRDAALNESVAPEAARILYSRPIYLPLVLKNT
jgi:hypothetical protein